MRALRWTAGVALLSASVVTTTGADPAGGRLPVAPPLLSQTGLYVAGTTAVDADNRRYSPQYPLWTDGATKRRWIRLPANASIDARNDEEWRFPVGTKLWKEFAFGGRRVETRLMWHVRPNVWVFASYAWSADQSEARLAPPSGLRSVAGTGASTRHSIPSLDDCHACHESGRVLGVNALQLSIDRDPLAPHAEPLETGMVTVQTLAGEGRLRGAPADTLTRPRRIEAGTPVARAALGYLATNCGICHRDGADIDTRLRLLPAISREPGRLLDLLTTARVSWDTPSLEPGARFIAPGHPERSSILARMRSRRPSTQMPPLGTTVVDREAMELIARWISEMPN